MLLRRRLVWQFCRVIGISMILATLGASLLVALFFGFPPRSTAVWIGFFALTGVATLLIASLSAAKLIAPILEDLAKSFQKVSTGDYSAELQSDSHEQIEEISLEFDRMTEQIGQQT